MGTLYFWDLPPDAERETKTSEFYCALLFAFADGGKRTRAACAASECVESWQQRKFTSVKTKVRFST